MGGGQNDYQKGERMGIDDAARAAKDRLDMVGRDDEPVIIDAEEVIAMATLLDAEPDVCDQVGADCRDCEEVLYHPHEIAVLK